MSQILNVVKVPKLSSMLKKCRRFTNPGHLMSQMWRIIFKFFLTLYQSCQKYNHTKNVGKIKSYDSFSIISEKSWAEKVAGTKFCEKPTFQSGRYSISWEMQTLEKRYLMPRKLGNNYRDLYHLRHFVPLKLLQKRWGQRDILKLEMRRGLS